MLDTWVPAVNFVGPHDELCELSDYRACEYCGGHYGVGHRHLQQDHQHRRARKQADSSAAQAQHLRTVADYLSMTPAMFFITLWVILNSFQDSV